MYNVRSELTLKNTSQKGSVLIMLVFLASIVAFFIIVSNASIFSREFNNTLDIRKKDYLETAKSKLESWYYKNAAIIDKTTSPVTITEDQLFKETGLTRMFGARIAITNVQYTAGSPLAFRNIAIWIPAFGVQDTSTFSATGVFQPNHAQTMYAVISGQKVEGDLMMQTQRVMKDAARLLEQRFKAKFEADPIHNVRVNYFASMSCASVGADEIPCTSTLDASTGWVSITNTNLNLWQAAGINAVTGTDAWGNQIYYSNDNQLAAIPNNPANNVDTPFYAVLKAVTPWNTTLYVYAMQPLN